jgi:hypothetical protein
MNMTRQPLFAGLVVDESGHVAETAFVGEPMYVVDDMGFRRHIPSEQVDKAVLSQIAGMMKGSEDLLSEQTAKMIGQEDIFTKAMLQNQLKNIDKQFDQLLETGLPEDARVYLGMVGFRIVINVHGEVLRVEQPSAPDEEGGDE